MVLGTSQSKALHRMDSIQLVLPTIILPYFNAAGGGIIHLPVNKSMNNREFHPLVSAR